MLHRYYLLCKQLISADKQLQIKFRIGESLPEPARFEIIVCIKRSQNVHPVLFISRKFHFRKSVYESLSLRISSIDTEVEKSELDPTSCQPLSKKQS